MPGTVVSSGTLGVLGPEAPQLALDGLGLSVQGVDERDAGGDVALPGLGQGESPQVLASPRSEQVAHRTGMAEGQQGGVDAGLQARALAHQVQAKAGPLALGAHERVGQPDRRHEIATSELG